MYHVYVLQINGTLVTHSSHEEVVNLVKGEQYKLLEVAEK